MCNSLSCLKARFESAKTLCDYNTLIEACSQSLSAKADLKTEEELYQLIEKCAACALELINPTDPFGWDDK